MGLGKLSLKLAKNIYLSALILTVVSRKNKFGFAKWFRLNGGGVIVLLPLFCFRIRQRACLVSGVKF